MTRFWTSAHQKWGRMYVRGYSYGKSFQEVTDYEPYMFIESPNGTYRTLEGTKAQRVDFQSVKEARDWIQSHSDVENKPIYGMSQFLYTFLNDEFEGTVEYDPDLIARCGIDIETDSSDSFPNIETADKEVTAITLTHRRMGEKKAVMFGTKVYRPSHPGVSFVLCEDETDMLSKFLTVWNDPDWTPDILTGWYIEGFDVPYLVRRIARVLGEQQVKLLSPFRIVESREISRGQTVGQSNSTQTVYEFFGVSILDYMELYKKFSFKNHESFSLDFVCRYELGRGKVDYSEYGTLDELYRKNYDLFMTYNLADCLLVDDLDEKCGFIDLVLAFAYDAKVTYNDTMTTTRPWDVVIHNYLMSRGIVVPQSLGSTDSYSIVGGYVKDPIVGMHDAVASFDFASLYPKVIIGWNISPETCLGKVDFDAIRSHERGTFLTDVKALQPMLKERNAILTGSGYLFSREKQGFLPAVISHTLEAREAYKAEMKKYKKLLLETGDKKYKALAARYHNLQLAKKIFGNALFGSIANQYMRWFANYLAESITMTGQMATRYMEVSINEYMNNLLKTEAVDRVIGMDTDSLYLNMGDLVKKVGVVKKSTAELIDFMDKACSQQIEVFISKRCEALTNLVNCQVNTLYMKREALSDRGIWTAKKRYILNVWDMEGLRYKEPEIKVVGIEAVRSSTPLVCRKWIKEALRIFLSGTEKELQDYIEDRRVEFKGLPFHEVASPRGVKDLRKYSDPLKVYGKSCPIAVRGALLYNHVLRTRNMTDKYKPIEDGSKIKFCYLKVPNPIRENVISAPGKLPTEFGLDKYLDHELQYEKSFVQPLEKISTAINWKTVHSGSLLDLLA